jgi:hypothetical protein
MSMVLITASSRKNYPTRKSSQRVIVRRDFIPPPLTVRRLLRGETVGSLIREWTRQGVKCDADDVGHLPRYQGTGQVQVSAAALAVTATFWPVMLPQAGTMTEYAP